MNRMPCIKFISACTSESNAHPLLSSKLEKLHYWNYCLGYSIRRHIKYMNNPAAIAVTEWRDAMIERKKYRRIADYEIHSKVDLLTSLLQNQQLELEESHSRYADLYDYAPVGYLTVDEAGNILSINMTGAALLRKERTFLIGKPFTDCFFQIDQQTFFDYLQVVFNATSKITIDLKIGDTHDPLSFIRLESTVISDKNICRMIMSDISQLKRVTNLNRDLLNENRRLMKELFRIQEKERRMLAYELHDELGQWLTAIRAENEVILNHTEQNSIISTSARAITECTQKMHQVIRGMLHTLCPLLDSLGLIDALYELKKQWYSYYPEIVLEFRLEGDLTTLDEQIGITVFRLIQEGLNNIYNHAEASWAQVSLSRKTIDNPLVDFLLLKIEDNGKGYDTNQQFTGLGLVSMRERVIAMNGRLTVRSANSEGTEINIRLPIENLDND